MTLAVAEPPVGVQPHATRVAAAEDLVEIDVVPEVVSPFNWIVGSLDTTNVPIDT